MTEHTHNQKIGLALGGGSTFGIAHIGVLAALVEAGIPIDCISGTSAGALVASCYAFGITPEKMKELVEEMSWKRVAKVSLSKMGMHSSEPMAAFLTDLVGAVQIEDANIPLAIVATNIETRKMAILRHGALQQAVRASTCLLGFFTPVEIDGALLVDGGLTENVPLTALSDMGATFKIAVNLANMTAPSRPKNMLELLSASMHTMSSHRDRDLALQSDVLIEPDLSAFNSMSFKDVESIYMAGYTAGRHAISHIQEKMQPKRPSAFGWLAKLFSFFMKS